METEKVIYEHLEQRRLKWYGHVTKLEQRSLCRTVQNWRIVGKNRRRHYPQYRKNNGENRENGDKWRSLIDMFCSNVVLILYSNSFCSNSASYIGDYVWCWFWILTECIRILIVNFAHMYYVLCDIRLKRNLRLRDRS